MNSSTFAESMTIRSMTFDIESGSEVTFDELNISMGYCANAELGTNYENNYVAGTKIEVFGKKNCTIVADKPKITFEVPFFYQPSKGNLIIDFSWPNGDHELYVFASGTTGTTCISGDYGMATGDGYSETPHLFLNGKLSLDQMTFAGIKASFR